MISSRMSLSPSYPNPVKQSSTDFLAICLCPAFGEKEWIHYRKLPVSSQFFSVVHITETPLSMPILLFVLHDQPPKWNSSHSFLSCFPQPFFPQSFCLDTARRGNCLLIRTCIPLSFELIFHFPCFLSHERILSICLNSGTHVFPL